MADGWAETVAQVLDVRGELCPIPVIRTRAAVKALAAGDVLEVIATDPLAELDLAVFCEHAGHQLLAARSHDGELRLRLRVGLKRAPHAAAD